jgi:signal transduction histidine kinase
LRLKAKLLLVLVIVCTGPLVTIAAISFITSLNSARAIIREDLDREVAAIRIDFDNLIHDRENKLRQLAASRPVIEFTSRPDQSDNLNLDLKEAVARQIQNNYFSAITVFQPDKKIIFAAETSSFGIEFRTTGFTENEGQPDPESWTATSGQTLCTLATRAVMGRTVRCATPLSNEPGKLFLLVADVNLSTLLMDVARQANSDLSRRMFVVLDRSGQIVFHTNDALKHQQVQDAFIEFAPVAEEMRAGRSGFQNYRAANGDQWVARYEELKPLELSVAVMQNSSQALSGSKLSGWLITGLGVLLGLGMATILAMLYRRRIEKIERVTEGVNAIAKGDLERFIEARSRDDIRPLADGVNLMTEQLRTQLAREAETRQFQNFVRLSAMLTHDLKNAISSLSLLVSNMEQHFDNPEFRADAMRALTETTQKMKALVERLSNPVTTLSGEFKLPEPVDLVPVIKRLLSVVTHPQAAGIEVETKLPATLIARVDAERMEKVIENLILNALEAMTGTGGTLLVQGDKDNDDRVWLKVSDSGVGMSPRFIEEKLFHAFATTKKKGMGLGLYTCREVIHAHGGTIEVQSKQGAGTTFSIVLPSPSSSKSVSKTPIISSQS